MKVSATVVIWAFCVAAVTTFFNGDDIADYYSRALQGNTTAVIDPLIQRVIMGHDGVCLNKRYHASIHDKRPGVKEEYAKFYQDNWRWDRFDADLPKVHKMQNPNLVVWETHASNTSSSLWTPTDASHYATGPGWDAPPNPSIMPTRTLVGKYGFYTSWFTGHYGHFNHDFLPTLAYMRKVAMTAYGDETRFILVEFWRSKEVVKFMDPVFYERIDWISDNEVVKIEGEVTYIEPLSIPEIAGHALMAYLREWMVEAHPFDQADFDANKHVLYYDRVGSSGVNHGRVLDVDHQKEIIIAIRKSMDKHGLGDQELVLFNGQNENGEALSPEEQFLAFRRASTLIGPHGTGFSNMVWTNPNPKSCEARTHVLEFVPGEDTAHVQCKYGGYYRSLRGLPLDYNEIFYQLPSTNAKTFISISELESALDDMWGGKQVIYVEPRIQPFLEPM